MKKKEIIEKIIKEYSNYGLTRIEVEISYVLAILGRVPRESIYPGLRIIFNKVYGIEDDKPQIEAGKALFIHGMNEVKIGNPEVSNKNIADGIEYIGIDTLDESLDDIDFSMLEKVKNSMLQSTERFLKENCK